MGSPINIKIDTEEGNKKINKVENSSKENELYKIAWDEIENNKTKQALWSKSFADSDGDENRTKAKYIKLRVKELKFEKENAKIKQKAEEKTELINENFLNLGLTQEDIDYLENPIRASEFLRKNRFPQKDLDKLIGEGKIKGSLVNGVLWVQDLKVKWF